MPKLPPPGLAVREHLIHVFEVDLIGAWERSTRKSQEDQAQEVMRTLP